MTKLQIPVFTALYVYVCRYTHTKVGLRAHINTHTRLTHFFCSARHYLIGKKAVFTSISLLNDAEVAFFLLQTIGIHFMFLIANYI